MTLPLKEPQNVGALPKLNKSQQIDGQEFKQLFNAGILWVKSNQQTINSLNVFPVPDGDTGTNMFLTLKSAYAEISESHEKNIGKIAKQISQGALMGARGNSGVILSQLLRGFARVLDDQPSMDAALFIRALDESRNTAYKGVVRPVEGTILTVAKDIARAAENAHQITVDLEEILEIVVQEADKSVRNTPELLPILKQAGVVDSGGKGLFFFLEGILRSIRALPVEIDGGLKIDQPTVSLDKMMDVDENIEPGQDYEIVVDFTPTNALDLKQFYDGLSGIGTSIQLGEGDDMYRMHIHVSTENQYLPIEYVKKIGNIKKVYIENLMEQMEKRRQTGKPNEPAIQPGQIAVIAISPGKGISEIFKSLGAAAVITGGQTMNPSTEEILESFKDLPTDKVIILPNNKNIILTAEAAKNASQKQVCVIPSRSVPQGLSACLHNNPDGDFEQICKTMNESLAEVDTGEVTTATRSITINDVKVSKGEVIGLKNGDLVVSSKNLTDTSIELLRKIGADQKEHITIFYGENVNHKELDTVIELIKTTFPDQEIEVHEGGQPFFQFILSVE
jgi:uncharacterized protein